VSTPEAEFEYPEETLIYLFPQQMSRLNDQEYLSWKAIRRSYLAWRSLRCPFDFFVSYRIAEAGPYAEALARRLKSAGAKVFMAGLEKVPETPPTDGQGGPLAKHLGSRLLQSRFLVMVGTSTFLDSEWVRWENETFEQAREGKMVPIVTPETPAGRYSYYRMIQERDGLSLFEGKRGWARQEPGRNRARMVSQRF
jgi:hypothetical protein